ncbi:MAG: agmatinase [Cyclobacteriaceae bacterium]|nr:agmatinase [Cyclobacteriaceae bacterium]
MVTVLGIPLDENSSFMEGAKAAPEAIRNAFQSPSTNYCTEAGLDLSLDKRWKDAGNLMLSTMPEAISEIELAIKNQVESGNKVLCLGGDHSITYPVVKAIASVHKNLNILHLDAHADLYDDFEGNSHSHASPFARIMEQGLAKRLVQVGIRTLNPHQRKQAERFYVERIEMKDWQDSMRFTFDGPVYLSLDLDALDPAFVPGVSHHEPGGFTTRQVISIIQNLKANLVGADIVELNPVRDINNMTAMVAAKLFKEVLSKLLPT